MLAVFFCWLFLFCPVRMAAHPFGGLADSGGGSVFLSYLGSGFLHILPYGLDHILFILSLFLLNSDLRKVLWQSAVFTLAHSVTLALSLYGIIPNIPHYAEPLIALSIVFVALENVVTDKLRSTRMVLIFFFGLVHGLGFAGALAAEEIPKNDFGLALVGFNLGVETGQVVVILSAWLLLSRSFGRKTWYRARIVTPLSIGIAAVATYWTVQRTFWP